MGASHRKKPEATLLPQIGDKMTYDIMCGNLRPRGLGPLGGPWPLGRRLPLRNVPFWGDTSGRWKFIKCSSLHALSVFVPQNRGHDDHRCGEDIMAQCYLLLIFKRCHTTWLVGYELVYVFLAWSGLLLCNVIEIARLTASWDAPYARKLAPHY